MEYSFFKRIICILSLILTFSCSSDLDFNQADQFNIKPVFTTNLAYFPLEANQFIVDGVEQSTFSYISNVDFFHTGFIRDDLVKTELYFRVKNTINRAYTYNIAFQDANNITIHNVNLAVPAYNGTEIVVEKTEKFDSTNIDILKNTKNITFSIAMLPGPPLTSTSPGRVELSSSITAYFDVK
ncbi:hypothetical protein [Flavobacterium aestivum]|uniref:hypothetical protein n=1 Tax=Flavobacterium aestivum TaxID=3003257 RepID=UPI0024829504|nr:hypothetical protein [Flavobacterium aestivum]